MKNKSNEITLKGNTIIEEFENYMKDHHKVSDIINFLSIKNAQLMIMTNKGLTEKQEDDILDFTVYFAENYEEITRDARYNNWGDEPFIFRLAENIINNREMAELESCLNDCNDFERHEIETLTETLFAIRKHRILTINAGDMVYQLEIPKTVYYKDLKQMKHELLLYCVQVIKNHGTIVVRLVDTKDHIQIFGIRTIGNIWSPISKEEMLDAQTLLPNGTRLEPEDNIEYTEIIRERM